MFPLSMMTSTGVVTIDAFKKVMLTLGQLMLGTEHAQERLLGWMDICGLREYCRPEEGCDSIKGSNKK